MTEHHHLLPSEIEVLQAFWDTNGAGNKLIAVHLDKSTKTVANQLASIAHKLDTQTRAGALIQAIRLGLIDTDRPPA
ncbi:MAG: LuxR C-terminal-related transcriptional regulator [Actinomycetota bacterium]